MDGLEHEDIALPKPGFGLDPRHWLGTQEPSGARRPGTSHRMAQERLHIRCMYIWGWVKTLVPSEPQNSW